METSTSGQIEMLERLQNSIREVANISNQMKQVRDNINKAADALRGWGNISSDVLANASIFTHGRIFCWAMGRN